MDLPKRRCLRGVTLVETMVCATITAVSVAVCLPFARSFGNRNALANLANAFLADLHLARSEAVKRRTPVLLCKSADGAACAMAGGWEQGWIVFADHDGDALRSPGEPLLQQVQALPAGLRVVGNLTVSRYIGFHPSGATRTASGAFQAGTVTLCWQREPETRQVIINAVGRPRIRKATAAECP